MEQGKNQKEIPPEERDFITTSRTAICIGVILTIIFTVIYLLKA